MNIWDMKKIDRKYINSRGNIRIPIILDCKIMKTSSNKVLDTVEDYTEDIWISLMNFV